MIPTELNLFAPVQEATRRHVRVHGCGAYTYADGSLPGVIAGIARARRVVEVGTALGYTALWLAHGAPDALVDTIENDDQHVALARAAIREHGMSERVTVHHGDADDILMTLDQGSYDVAFFDGFTPTLTTITAMRGLLRPGGTLVAGNLTLGISRAVEADLENPTRWLVHSLGETALCVKQGTA